MATAQSGSSGDLAVDILQALSQSEPILTAELFPDLTFAEVKSALARLAGRSMIAVEPIEREEIILEPEGEQIADNGSHEARVFEALRQAVDGLSIAGLEKVVGDKSVVKLGQSKAFKEKWISKGKDGKFVASVSNGRVSRPCAATR